MKPTPEQIRAALANHHRPARTPHARIRDAIAHSKLAHEKAPREQGLSMTSTENATDLPDPTQQERGSRCVSQL